MTGFEVLESLPAKIKPPLVIFVTGYDQYALAAFEANALAYLLKPVEPERLAQAVARACRLANQAPRTLRQIVCRKRDRALLVAPGQIFWFQMADGIVRAHTAAETYWVNYQLGELEAALPADEFFRARRETLVNLARIKEIRPFFRSGFVLVMGDAASTEIQVSERQARTLRQRIPGL
jgi:two-component system, LytTR family, response regulator